MASIARINRQTPDIDGVGVSQAAPPFPLDPATGPAHECGAGIDDNGKGPCHALCHQNLGQKLHGRAALSLGLVHAPLSVTGLGPFHPSQVHLGAADALFGGDEIIAGSGHMALKCFGSTTDGLSSQ